MENYELLKTITKRLLEDPNIYQGVVRSIPPDYIFYPEEETITLEDIVFLYLLEQLEDFIKTKIYKEDIKHA